MALKLEKEHTYIIDDLCIIFRNGKLEISSIDKDLIVQPVVHNKVKISSIKVQ